MRKHVFYIHTNIATKKWGEKCAKQLFQKHTNRTRKKCWEKKSKKSVEKLFLYSHKYRDQKIGGKSARNNFSSNTHIVQAKNVGKKSSQKMQNSASKKC